MMVVVSAQVTADDGNHFRNGPKLSGITLPIEVLITIIVP